MSKRNRRHSIGPFHIGTRRDSFSRMREELARVLAYPKLAPRVAFHRGTADAVLQDFDRHAALVEAPAKAGVTCGDPDDQKFIDLAVAHRCPLVSKDFEVLRMKKRLAQLEVLATPCWVG